MKITAIELVPVFSTREMGRTGPSDPEGAVSYHVITLLRTDAGVTGLGEMSDVNFSVSRSAIGNLSARLEPMLVGRDPFDLTAIQTDLYRQQWDHQVLAGVDIALHDLIGKALEVPVYQLFGGKVRDRIPFSYPLSTCQVEADIQANLGRVETLLEQGHSTIRYYFGADLDLDERFLSELRLRWGEDVHINALDASGRFEVREAIDAIARMAPFKPNVVESPVKGREHAPIEDFVAVRREAVLPIGEHVAEASAGIAANLAKHDAVDVFNIGIGYEGMTPARKLFALAEAYGIKTLLGSTVELSIGTAAAAHLVAAMPNLTFPCYPSGPLVYHERVVKEPVRYEEGHIVVPEGPGLGMELDKARLEAQIV